MLAVEQARHDDVTAFDQSHVSGNLGLRNAVQNLLHPRAGSIYERTRADLECLLSLRILTLGDPEAALAAGRNKARASENGRAAFSSVDGVQNDQATVVDPAIRVGERVIQSCSQRSIGAVGNTHAA